MEWTQITPGHQLDDVGELPSSHLSIGSSDMEECEGADVTNQLEDMPDIGEDPDPVQGLILLEVKGNLNTIKSHGLGICSRGATASQ